MDKHTVDLAIEGMTCDHCAATIQHALAGVPGVERADVSFPDKRAAISTKGTAPAAQAPDFPAVIAQKDALVTALRQEKYWDVLSAYPNVTLRQGRGVINPDLSITVDSEVLKPGRIIVTTGAAPWAPPIAELAEAGYLTSTEALALTTRPVSMVVIGGSAVGLEIAQLYARLRPRGRGRRVGQEGRNPRERVPADVAPRGVRSRRRHRRPDVRLRRGVRRQSGRR